MPHYLHFGGVCLLPFLFFLSRTPKGANQQIKGGSMSTLVDREPNSRREASDVAAQISSPVPGVWFSVPTGDLAIRYI